MVRITEQLIRKRSEHNELIIGTLEELSLHQEDIERIEHIGHWCRELKILLLQSNLIARLENLQRLKKLEYLNMALNNIERIENLAPLESLRKLDLTLNFIGELTVGVDSLRANYNLRELFLTGNPCTDYPGYREYVVTVLPQLEYLDGQEITRSERLRAARENFPALRERMVQREAQYAIERDEQKVRVLQSLDEQEDVDEEHDDERRTTDFWQQKSEHCPETRIQMAKFSRRAKNRPGVSCGEQQQRPPPRRLFAECGRPYNVNEPRLGFEFRDEPDRYELDLHLYRFLDTSLVEVDAQPGYVRVTVKGKVFQLALRQEIQTDRSTCQRSMTTGHMLVVMPKLNPERIVVPLAQENAKPVEKQRHASSDGGTELRGSVNIRAICDRTTNNRLTYDDDEIPDLI